MNKTRFAVFVKRSHNDPERAVTNHRSEESAIASANSIYQEYDADTVAVIRFTLASDYREVYTRVRLCKHHNKQHTFNKEIQCVDCGDTMNNKEIGNEKG